MLDVSGPRRKIEFFVKGGYDAIVPTPYGCTRDIDKREVKVGKPSYQKIRSNLCLGISDWGFFEIRADASYGLIHDVYVMLPVEIKGEVDT